MAANSGHIDLVQSCDLTAHPMCSHGPTLLFTRYDPAKSGSRQFYACSAFRDKKECSFFQWADDEKECKNANDVAKIPSSHHDMRKRYHKFRKLAQSDRHVCCSCGLLMLREDWATHQAPEHVIRQGVGRQLLKCPSDLFTPLDNNKTFAQYLFSKKSLEFIVQTLDRLSFTHILCVGTPRIHEAVQKRFKSGDPRLKSFLLDLDERYGQIFPPAKWAKYNMFNHHFFEETGRLNTSNFLTEGSNRTLIVTDPPFGGMVDALVASFQQLSDMTRQGSQLADMSRQGTQLAGQGSSDKTETTPIIWFFPYFLESRIVSQYPEMTMLDYKVDYDNHNLYKNDKKQKGSPVRIFTTLPPEQFVLPKDEGYWFCKECKRYSSKENKHCTDCGTCTSKDGTTYYHCDACMRCVKATRVHCYTCMVCDLKDHVCGRRLKAGCHICGEINHKRRDCPQIEKKNTSGPSKQKRKIVPHQERNMSHKHAKLVSP